MRRLGIASCILILCVSVPMTIIKSADTPRPQAPVRPQPIHQPKILRPEPGNPFILPHYIHEVEEKQDRTA